MTTSPPIAITGLSIRDFRGVAQLDLDFCRPDGKPNSLVVLAGPNGCGKTAVLEAALIAVGGSKLATGRQHAQAIRPGAQDYFIEAHGYHVPGLALNWFSQSNSRGHDDTVELAHWYFSSWRSPELVGPIDVSLGGLK